MIISCLMPDFFLFRIALIFVNLWRSPSWYFLQSAVKCPSESIKSPVMTNVTLYRNPRCSKSRAAAEYPHGCGIGVRILNYPDTPPSVEELRGLCRKLGLADPRGMMGTKDGLYGEPGLDEADGETLLAAIAAHPALLERPVAVCGDYAAIGRPLDNIAALPAGKVG